MYVPTQQKQHTFKSYNHVISCTSCAKANALAEWTETILIQPIVVVLSETITTEFSITYILFIWIEKINTFFGITQIAISFSAHKTIWKFWLLKLYNLWDIRIVIWWWCDWSSIFRWVVITFHQISFRVNKFAMMTNVEFLHLFSCFRLRKISFCFFHFLQNIFIF